MYADTCSDHCQTMANELQTYPASLASSLAFDVILIQNACTRGQQHALSQTGKTSRVQLTCRALYVYRKGIRQQDILAASCMLSEQAKHVTTPKPVLPWVRHDGAHALFAQRRFNARGTRASVAGVHVCVRVVVAPCVRVSAPEGMRGLCTFGLALRTATTVVAAVVCVRACVCVCVCVSTSRQAAMAASVVVCMRASERMCVCVTSRLTTLAWLLCLSVLCWLCLA